MNGYTLDAGFTSTRDTSPDPERIHRDTVRLRGLGTPFNPADSEHLAHVSSQPALGCSQHSPDHLSSNFVRLLIAPKCSVRLSCKRELSNVSFTSRTATRSYSYPIRIGYLLGCAMTVCRASCPLQHRRSCPGAGPASSPYLRFRRLIAP